MLDHREGAEGNRQIPFLRHDSGVLLLAFGVCLGAAVYLTLHFEPGLLPLTCLFVGSALTGILGRRFGWPHWSTPVLLAVSGSCLGVLAGKTHSLLRPPPFLMEETEPVILEGWLMAVEPGRNGARLRILPHAISGIDPERMPPRIRVTHRLSLTMEPGRFVRCFVVLRPPPGPSLPGDPDFRRRAWFEGLGAVGYVQGRCRGGALGHPKRLADQFQLAVGQWRRQLGLFVKDAAGERAGGFAAALVSGDRSHMAIEDQEALRASGLAHLLAISGLHMGIVSGLIYLMVFRGLALIEPLALRFPVQKLAAGAAIAASSIYLILSGASVSTQRAFIMAVIIFMGIIVDRNAISFRGYAIALLLVALTAPHSVVSPGFQMSFAATGVLIAIYEGWHIRRYQNPVGPSRTPVGRATFSLQSLVVTSVAASLATLPFALFHFGRIAPFGILTNLVAMPIVTFVTAPIAGLCLLLAPFGLADFGLAAFGWSLEWILAIASYSASAAEGGAPTYLSMPGIVFSFCIGALAVFVAFRGRQSIISGAVLASAAVVFWMITPRADLHWEPSGDIVLAASSLSGPERIETISGAGLGSLRFSDLEVSQTCPEGCSFISGGIRLEIARGGTSSPCLSAKTTDLVLWYPEGSSVGVTNSAECAPVFSWHSVVDAGGYSFYRKRNGIRAQQAALCTNRPWQSCSKTNGS